MQKLRVAILEDNKDLLKDLKLNLEATGFAEVVVFAQNSEQFLEKVSASGPEALIMDIDLGSDSMNGIDIANKLKLPVLFVSGKSKEYLNEIEELNLHPDLIVEHITKPISSEKLNRILPKFIREINSRMNEQYIFLDFKDSKQNRIDVRTIVYLETDTGSSGESNNKRIFFTDRKPELLYDFSFSKMKEKGMHESTFITTHKSYRVNGSKIIRYDNSKHEVVVMACSPSGKLVEMNIPVSDNYRKTVRGLKP